MGVNNLNDHEEPFAKNPEYIKKGGKSLMTLDFTKIKKNFADIFAMSSGLVKYSERFNFSQAEIKEKSTFLLNKLKKITDEKTEYDNLSFKSLARIGLQSKDEKVQAEIDKTLDLYAQKAAIASDLIELSLYQAIESGDILDWKNQSNFKEAMLIFDKLPKYIQKISSEKIQNFEKKLQIRNKLIGLSGKRIMSKLFGFTPRGKVEVEISPFSGNIYFEKHEDFKLFQGDEYVSGAMGFAQSDKIFGQIIVMPKEIENPNTKRLYKNTPEQIKMVLDHETQHAKFSYINPFNIIDSEKIDHLVNTMLNVFVTKPFEIEELRDHVSRLFFEIKNTHFLHTKNEVLAFVKGGADSVAEIKLIIKEHYNYIENFSENIKSEILENEGVYPDFNIAVLFHLIDNQVNICNKEVDKLLKDLLDDEEIFNNPEKITKSTLTRIDGIFDRK